MEKIERQQFKCLYSSRELTPQTTNLDHIVPVVNGGGHDAENLGAVHCAVNAAKGTMTLPEFVAMCRDVVVKFGMTGDVKEKWSELVT